MLWSLRTSLAQTSIPEQDNVSDDDIAFWWSRYVDTIERRWLPYTLLPTLCGCLVHTCRDKSEVANIRWVHSGIGETQDADTIAYIRMSIRASGQLQLLISISGKNSLLLCSPASFLWNILKDDEYENQEREIHDYEFIWTLNFTILRHMLSHWKHDKWLFLHTFIKTLSLAMT